MANSAQARQANVVLRSKVRSSIKKVRTEIEGGSIETATAAFKAAVPVIDSMVNKGVLHANAAARQKQRLNNAIRTLG